MPEQQISPQLADLMGRIAKLPGANLEPPQFFANFLQLTVAATGADAGAIWIAQPGQGLQCYCHIDIELSGINQSETQKKLILTAVQNTLSSGKILVVPPAGAGISEVAGAEPGAGENQLPRALFFKPLRAAQQVAMVLQTIAPENLDPHLYRTVVGLLDQAGEAGETYLAHRRAAVLDDDRKALARLLKFDEGVYGSLDPEKVVYQIANLGREAVACERVAVWIDPQVKRGLRAVSGVDKPDQRAVLMQCLEKLSRYCLQIQKPILASRDQLKELAEEEELTALLKAYFNASQLNQIFLQPMKGQEQWIGVMIAEGFDEQTTTNLAGVAATAARHGAIALENALQASAKSLMSPFARFAKGKKGASARKKWITISLGAALGLLLVALIPWTIRVDCRCELVPRPWRLVDSSLDGVQIDHVLIPRGQVRAQDVVVQLNDEELQAKLLTLEADKKQVQIDLDKAVRPAETENAKFALQRLQSQIDLVKWQIEKCQVRSPINGTILTDQLELKEGITLKKGDPIFEVADLESWQLLLDVPQEEVGWVQRGLLAEPEDSPGSRVQFFLAAYPEYKMECRIRDRSQISQMARVKEKGSVFEARLDVPAEQLQKIHANLRSGSTGRAKIDTARRPLGYVLLRKVIRFFRVTFF